VGEEVQSLLEACFEEVAREEVGPSFDRERDGEDDTLPGDCESEELPGKPPAFFGSAWKRGETCTLTLEVGSGANGTSSPRELEPLPGVERGGGE